MKSWNCTPVDNWRSASHLWISRGDGCWGPRGGVGCVLRPFVKPVSPLRGWLVWVVKPVSPLRAWMGLFWASGAVHWRRGFHAGMCGASHWCRGLCSSAFRETGIAFAGVNGPVLSGWGRALASRVSNVGLWGRALASRVSLVSVSRRALVSWVSNASVGAHAVAHWLHARLVGVARLFQHCHESSHAPCDAAITLDVSPS